MSVELNSAKADALARELAAATGEDIETAVEKALEESLTRVSRPGPVQPNPQLDVIFDRLAAMQVLDSRSPDEIIGFDRTGLPV